jgi:hypothetical protein
MSNEEDVTYHLVGYGTKLNDRFDRLLDYSVNEYN